MIAEHGTQLTAAERRAMQEQTTGQNAESTTDPNAQQPPSGDGSDRDPREDERERGAGRLADMLIQVAREECTAAGRQLTIDELEGRGLKQRIVEKLSTMQRG